MGSGRRPNISTRKRYRKKPREPNAEELRFCFVVHLCGINYDKGCLFAAGLGFKPPSPYRFYQATEKIRDILASLVLLSIYRALQSEAEGFVTNLQEQINQFKKYHLPGKSVVVNPIIWHDLAQRNNCMSEEETTNVENVEITYHLPEDNSYQITETTTRARNRTSLNEITAMSDCCWSFRKRSPMGNVTFLSLKTNKIIAVSPLINRSQYQNFDEKAKAMEGHGTKLCCETLAEMGYTLVTFLHDGDSSSFSAVKGVFPDCKEQFCRNHTAKNLGKFAKEKMKTSAYKYIQAWFSKTSKNASVTEDPV